MKWSNGLGVAFALGSVLAGMGLARTARSQEIGPDELSPAARDGKWGYVNDKRKFVIEPQFDLASPFFEGLAAVQKGERVGYIDRKTRMIIEPQFAAGGAFAGGLAGVRMKGRFGFIDRKGNLVIPAKFDAVGSFSEGLASAKSGGKYGFIDGRGEWVVEPRFELAGPFSGGHAAVKAGGKYGYVDRAGKMVITPQFEWAGTFSEGLAGVKVKDKYGFVNHEGDMAIGPKFSGVAGAFSEGLCGALDEETKKYEFIDREGKVAINAKFEAIGSFHKGLASASIEDKAVFISPSGEFTSEASPLVEVNFVTVPPGAELRVTEEWRWFTSTDREYLFSTLEPRPEGKTTRKVRLSKDTVYRVFFIFPDHPRRDRQVDPAATNQVEVDFR